MPELVVTLAVHSVRCAENKSPFTFACFILRIDSRAERLHDLLCISAQTESELDSVQSWHSSSNYTPLTSGGGKRNGNAVVEFNQML